MPPRKMRMHNLAYSIYSAVLWLPNREMTRSGASSKIRKAITPTPITSFVMD